MNTVPAVQKAARILVVDDDEANAWGLSRIVEKAGYAVCITMTNPEMVVERFLEIAPDIVLLDLHMKPISGLEVLKQINQLLDPHLRPPVLILTADTSPEAKYEALEAGATDFLAKPLDHCEVMLRIKLQLQSRALFQQCQHYSHSLEQLVQERTKELQARTKELEVTLQDLRSTEKQVIQQERIRALGTMASGIAHDMNNSLTLILGYGEILLDNCKTFRNNSEQRSLLEGLVRAARDNAQMVKRLREFYRPRTEHEDRQPVDLDELITQVVAFTAPKWQAQAEAKGVNIDIEYSPGDIPTISGSPAELREVLTNLIFNAVDAMPHGGKIRFATKSDEHTVQLEVSDTGTGMTEDTCRRCLEPFYTTKGDNGSGLGLAVSYGIIRRHGGSIDISSVLNRGTTFTLTFPIACDECSLKMNGDCAPCRPLRILVVDDQEGIRDIISAYLTEDCHMVETAAGAAEAMEKFMEGRFDLVITDRAMPEINGEELAASIKRVNPQEPVIMLTGFADVMDDADQKNENVDMVLGKPTQLNELRRAIGEVVQRLDSGVARAARN